MDVVFWLMASASTTSPIAVSGQIKFSSIGLIVAFNHTSVQGCACHEVLNVRSAVMRCVWGALICWLAGSLWAGECRHMAMCRQCSWLPCGLPCSLCSPALAPCRALQKPQHQQLQLWWEQKHCARTGGSVWVWHPWKLCVWLCRSES